MECRLFSISLVVVLFGDFVVWGGVGRSFNELEVTYDFAVLRWCFWTFSDL